jgi:hypothetical protein
MAEFSSILVNMPYLKKDDSYLCEKPYTTDFAVDHIPGANPSNHRFDYQSLSIADAQNCREGFELQKHGFCFLKAKTSITPDSAKDNDYVRKVHFPEVETLLHKALPGYERIEYLDHLVSLLSPVACVLRSTTRERD